MEVGETKGGQAANNAFPALAHWHGGIGTVPPRNKPAPKPLFQETIRMAA